MLYDNIFYLGTNISGYIAGIADGIVTVAGQPAQRDIVILSAQNLSVVARSSSLNSGHYLIQNLDPTKQYLIICRDYNKAYEPAVWDYVTPAADLTVTEQQALWTSWQI